jgi:aspartate kinase
MTLGAKKVLGDDAMAKLSIVGVGIKSHPGVAGRMFKALADAKINIEMISTSEIKLSVIIRQAELDKAVQVIHNEFALDRLPA